MDLYRALYDSQDDGKLYAECVLAWLDCKYPHLTHQAGRFLDLGCGNGNFLKAFHQQASEWELYGIDQRVSIIEEARSNCPAGNFNVGTFPPLPYEDNFFNLVFSKNIFDYADTRPKESKIGSSIVISASAVNPQSVTCNRQSSATPFSSIAEIAGSRKCFVGSVHIIRHIKNGSQCDS